MEVRITKTRAAAAALFVMAGVGLGSMLSPLVATALANVGHVVNISDPLGLGLLRHRQLRPGSRTEIGGSRQNLGLPNDPDRRQAGSGRLLLGSGQANRAWRRGWESTGQRTLDESDLVMGPLPVVDPHRLLSRRHGINRADLRRASFGIATGKPS
jgi:hypothetical protein